MSEFDQSYQCRLCNEEIKVLQQECSRCGLTSGYYQRNSVDGKITLHCAECDAVLKPLSPPDICNLGHRGHCGWFNSTSEQWIEADLSTNNIDKKAIWVKGDFQGVYTGELEFAGITFSNEDQRSYNIENFQIAILKNPQLIDNPPNKTPLGKKPPIRVEISEQVIVEYEDSASGESSTFSVALHDFRLHDWQEVRGAEISGFFGQATTGRISGTAYGLLKPVVPHPLQKSLKASDKKQTAGKFTDNVSSSFSDLSTTLTAASSKFLNLTAPSSTDNSDINSKNISNNKKDYVQCLACSMWLHLILTAAVWYFCGWQHALIFISIAQATCRLADFTTSNKWVIQNISKRYLLIGLIALLVNLGILFEAYSLAFSDDCALVSDWAIYLIAIAFVLTALLTFCWLRLILLLVWFLTLLLWCSANGVVCDRNLHTNRLDQFFDEINIHIDTVIHPDIISDIVNDVTTDPDNPDNNRKISIDEINNDPKLLENCKNSIYFPEVALFTKGSPKIEPRAHGQLRKLIPVLKSHNGKKFIITGHADKSGDETDTGYLNNITLSDQRAAAVAKWLIEHDAVDASMLDSRGAGTSMPLTNDPQRADFNRRVEIQMECKNQNENIKR